MELKPELKKKFHTYNQQQLNNAFLKACEHGHLDIVKYLLTSPELQKHADIHVDSYYGFHSACFNGHIEVVRYLLTSPELNHHADIHSCNNNAFYSACHNGHLDVVSYLLTSPELQEHADVHAYNNEGFQSACSNDHLDVVQYLLSLDREKCIDFQNTKYNLDWAIENKYSDIVFSMMKSLHRQDIDVFNAHVERVMTYFMKESFEHGVTMMNEFHLPSTEFPTECNLVL